MARAKKMMAKNSGITVDRGRSQPASMAGLGGSNAAHVMSPSFTRGAAHDSPTTALAKEHRNDGLKNRASKGKR